MHFSSYIHIYYMTGLSREGEQNKRDQDAERERNTKRTSRLKLDSNHKVTSDSSCRLIPDPAVDLFVILAAH